MDTGITVTGTGQATAPADLLRLTLSVGQDAPDVADAVAQVAERTDAVKAALLAEGVASDDVATSSVSVHPQYGDQMTVTGYRASHSMIVTTTDLTGFGRLLNAAVAAVGNSLGLDFLQFDVKDKAALVDQARQLAFQQARQKAEQLAALTGQSIGGIAGVSETQGYVPLRRDMAAKAVGLSAGGFSPEMGVTPGEQSIDVTLEVRWNWA
ncbi:SIMPL domain-containing protein [Kribbella sp. NPDC051770]|uniref:SIMPL domain-containing protein n=1 Tax=Kribbella sp. NPDC051770 TaxID=3155413 RepID=UPI00341F7956